MIDIAEIRRQGWFGLDIEGSDEALVELAKSIGTPVRFNESLIRRLRPVKSEDAPRGTFGRVHGTNSYPLHTDVAFWPTPARYLVLTVSGDLRRRTHLYSWNAVTQSLGRELRRRLDLSIWLIRGTGRPFLATMRFRESQETGYRFDPLCMLPVNPAARDVRIALTEILSTVKPLEFDWSVHSVLVIDNWLMLHGRGISPPAESNRTLSRIYVNQR